MVNEITEFGNIELTASEERERTLREGTFERNELDETVDVTDEAVQEGINAMVASLVTRFQGIATPADFMSRVAVPPERAAATAAFKTEIFAALAAATGEPQADDWGALGPESQWIVDQLVTQLATEAGAGYSLAFLQGPTEVSMAPAETIDVSREAVGGRLADLETISSGYPVNPLSNYVAKMRLVFDAPANADASEAELTAFNAQITAVGRGFLLLDDLRDDLSAEAYDAVLNDPNFERLLESPDADFVEDMPAVLTWLESQRPSTPDPEAEPPAETYTPTPEMAARSAAAIAFLDEFSPTLERFMQADVASSLPLVRGDAAEIIAGIRAQLENPSHLAAHTLILATTEFFQEHEEVVTKIANGTATPAEVEALSAAMEAMGERLSETLETPQAAPPIPTETIDELGIDPAITRLIEGVPDSERGTPEYEQWLTALEGGERRPYEQYVNEEIIPNAEGMRGTMIALRMQLAPIIEMIREFMKMFDFTGESDADRDELRAQQEERQEEILRDAARASGISPEEFNARRRQVETREQAEPINAFFTQNPQVIIADFFDSEGGNHTISEAKITAYIQAHEGFEVGDLNNLVSNIRDRLETDHAADLLSRGLSMNTLNVIAQIPAGRPVRLEGDDIIIGETHVPLSPAESFERRVDTAIREIVAAEENARAAAEQEAARTALLNTVARTIAEQGLADFESEEAWAWGEFEASEVYIDDNGDTRGFSIEDGKIFADFDTGFAFTRAYDAEDQDLEVLNLSEVNLAALGFENEDALLTLLRDTFSGKTLAEIQQMVTES